MRNFLLFSLSWAVLSSAIAPAPGADTQSKLKVLIVDGQNNHAWQRTTPVLKAALDSAGLFAVDVATSPAQGQSLAEFKPDFAHYRVIVSNYNGEDWPEPTRRAFEDYVKNGGGFVSVHAADNAFPKWAEYNRMIAVRGWGSATIKRADAPLARRPGGSGPPRGRRHAWPVLLLRHRDP